MTAETSMQILVIILSSTLAIFLILAIIAVVILIQVLNYLKSIMKKAEEIADRAEAVSEFFQQSASSAAIGRLVANIANTVFNRDKKK